jgi:hypothetical protein
MKLCSKCKEEITELNVLYRTKEKKRSAAYCKKCFYKYVNERRVKLKIEAVEMLGGKCQDCDKVYPYQVYDFHHLDPSIKEFSWDYARRVSRTRMMAELKKCVLLCSNCHRERHIQLDALEE